MIGNNRQQTLTVLAVVALALLLGDSLVVTPLIKSWKERSTKIADLRKSVAKGEQVIEREDALRSRWSSMQTNMLSAELSAAQSEILKTFDRWERESRIKVNSIKPQWKRNADDYSTLECRVDATGSLGSITRYLHAIEKSPSALRIESVEITTRDTTGQQLSLGLLVSGLRLGELEERSR